LKPASFSCEVFSVAALDIAHRVCDQHRNVEHRPCVPEVSPASFAGKRQRLVQQRRSRPAFRKVSRAQKDDDTGRRGRSKTVILQNLAKLSMPALVRESEAKDHPLVESQADAVGHARRP